MLLVIYYTETSTEEQIKMNSNQANESDGSFHIRVEPKKKPKPIPKEVETKKEVKKNDKKDRK